MGSLTWVLEQKEQSEQLTWLPFTDAKVVATPHTFCNNS